MDNEEKEVKVQEYEKIVKQLNIVVAEVKSIAGTVSRDDATDDETKKIFTSGSVRYIDPTHLKTFLAARTAATRAGRAAGVRFLSGYAVTDEQLPAYLEELKELGKGVEKKKAAVVGNWTTLLAEWEQAHPEVARFRHAFPNATHATNGIGFSVSLYKINPSDTVIEGVQDGIKSEVAGLAGRVIEEIAQDVRDSWKPDAAKATQRIKGLLNRTKEKLRSLSFLDGGRLAELAVFIEDTIGRLPSTGMIEGTDFIVLSGLMSILGSPEKMASATLAIQDFSAEAADDEEVEMAADEGTEIVLSDEVPPNVIPLVPVVEGSRQENAAYSW